MAFLSIYLHVCGLKFEQIVKISAFFQKTSFATYEVAIPSVPGGGK